MKRFGGMDVVATFGSLPEAEAAAGALRANGFDALVTADDCAGLEPHLRVLLSVHVVVPAEEGDLARELLELVRAENEADAEPSDAPDEAPLGRVPFRKRSPVFWTMAIIVLSANLFALMLLAVKRLAAGWW